MNRLDGVRRLGPPVLWMALLAGSTVGCGDALGLYYPTTSGTVEVVTIDVTPSESGGANIAAVLELTLSSYEESDEVALDAVSLLLGSEPMTVDDVVVDDGDWPVALAADETQSRRLRVTGHVDQLPYGTVGLCAASLPVEASVGLLVGVGETIALGYGDAPFAPSGPRLGLARRGSEVAASFDASLGTVEATVDEDGTTWMLVRSGYVAQAHLASRLPSGEVEIQALPIYAATMAAAPGGGVFLAESYVGTVEVSLRRSANDVAWTRTVRAGASSMEVYVPIAGRTDGVTIAVSGDAGASVDGVPSALPTLGSLLVDFDLEGTPRAVAPIVRSGHEATWVSGLVAVDDLLVVGTGDSLLARRDGVEVWSAPFSTYLLAAGAGRVVAAGETGIAMFDAEDGAQIWIKPGWEAWVPSSMALRESGELLLASSNGEVARWGADGAVLFDDQVVCSQPVAFGSASGRVAYAAIVAGREGWGDAPDRDVASPLLALGEVLP